MFRNYQRNRLQSHAVPTLFNQSAIVSNEIYNEVNDSLSSTDGSSLILKHHNYNKDSKRKPTEVKNPPLLNYINNTDDISCSMEYFDLHNIGKQTFDNDNIKNTYDSSNDLKSTNSNMEFISTLCNDEHIFDQQIPEIATEYEYGENEYIMFPTIHNPIVEIKHASPIPDHRELAKQNVSFVDKRLSTTLGKSNLVFQSAIDNADVHAKVKVSASLPTVQIDDSEDDMQVCKSYSTFTPSCKPDVCNVGLQVPASFSASTPCKIAIRLKLRAAREKLRRTLSNISKIKRKNSLFKKDLNIITAVCEKYFPPKLSSFVLSQLKLSQIKPCGRRYSASDKIFALNLYYTSPNAYRLLTNYFYLPSKTVLSKWLQFCQIDAGFDDKILNAIKRKTENMTYRNKHCTLIIDETSIKSHLQRHSRKDYIIGFEDYGNSNRTRNVASNVLVFMLRGIASKWKLQLAFFFTTTSCKAAQLNNLLFECLDKVTSIGLNVVAIISDQGSNMLQLSKQLGISTEKPYFEYLGRRYYYIFDPPHLIKSTRNNLKKHTFKYDGKSACWSYLRQFYQLDVQQKYRLAPKITLKHIDLPGFRSDYLGLVKQSLNDRMYVSTMPILIG